MGTPTLIGLGSNLGDRQTILDGAVSAIAAIPGVELRAVSSYHETAPVGGPAGQGPFLNAAALVKTTLSPSELHDRLKEIEREAGRVRVVRWGERTLDLDLLLFGDQIIEDESLTVPHPRMAVRRFVLAPAAEIASESEHPVTGWTIAKLLANLDRRPSVLILRWTPDLDATLFREVVQRLDAVAIGDGTWTPRVASALSPNRDPAALRNLIAMFYDDLQALRTSLSARASGVAGAGERWIVTDRHPDVLLPHLLGKVPRPGDHWSEIQEAKREVLAPTFAAWPPNHRGAWMSFCADKWSRRSRPTFDFPIIRPDPPKADTSSIVEEIVAACLASRPSTGNP